MKHPSSIYVQVLLILLTANLAVAQHFPGGVKNHNLWIKGNTEKTNPENTIMSAFNFHPKCKPLSAISSLDFKGKNVSLFLVNSNPKSSDVLMLGSETVEPIVITDAEVKNQRALPYFATPDLSKIIFYRDRWDRKISSEPSLFLDNAEESLIAEIILFDRAISHDQQKRVHSYLAIKYGISLLETSDYISSDGAVIFNGSEETDYISRVTALGRDDKSELYQKQSINNRSDFFFCLSLDKLQDYNFKNKGELTDGSFIFWGDDDKALEVSVNKEDKQPAIARSWKFNLDAMLEDKKEVTLYIELPKDIQVLYPKNWYVNLGDNQDKLSENKIIKLKQSDNNLWEATFYLDKKEGMEQYLRFVNISQDILPRSTTALELFPNPVKRGEKSMLSFQNPSEGDVNYFVRDESGRLLDNQNLRFDEGSHSIEILFSHVGLHTVELIVGEKKYTKKIVVVD